MKVLITIVIYSLALILDAYGQDNSLDLQPDNLHFESFKVIRTLLNEKHYLKDDMDSIALWNQTMVNYINTLDRYKLFLTTLEVDDFLNDSRELDDKAKLALAFGLFNLYSNKVISRYHQIEETLNQGFDFSEKERYETDSKKRVRKTTEEELDEQWRLYLKYQAFIRKSEGTQDEGIREELAALYKHHLSNFVVNRSEDVFYWFVNAMASAYDPHTKYYTPEGKKNYESMMSLSYVGLGIKTASKGRYHQVTYIYENGPAHKSGVLQVGDYIVGIMDSLTEEIHNTEYWSDRRFSGALKRRQGDPITVVKCNDINFNSLENKLDTITLIRDTIEMKESSAKAELISIQIDGIDYKIGLVRIPSFYRTMSSDQKKKRKNRSLTEDVKYLIDSLKAESIDGLVLDIRDNGGGSLLEAISLTDLFINTGTVVQTKSHSGLVQKHRGLEKGYYYDGPLAVLVNRNSASASEIFAGAIQDYKRGVILGEQTFGKGTVQNIFDLSKEFRSGEQASEASMTFGSLNEDLPSEKMKFGQLNITISKFYRPSGKSTQLSGITPDVVFKIERQVGERKYESALSCDSITASRYYKETNYLLSRNITKLREEFLAHSILDADLHKELKNSQKKSLISLDLKNKENLASQNQDRDNVLVPFVFSSDEVLNTKLSNDPYLKESLRLLVSLLNEF